ncbi:MAG: YggS family pyridoxal phosphate-dependent enzyme, partial [Firmicutes bacterium]|nr:YggS family pyridoxal phosphate-dependent enzyme [Bacillota bacterium]
MDKNLENNTKEIFQKIKYACEKASRCDKEITLLAATKTVSSNVIKCLLNHGITEVGENRAQELVEKYNAEFGLNWHFVGHLQTNKVKSVVGKVTLIHSLDRVSLADEINKCAEKMNIIQDVLIEINIGEEGSKSGIEVWKFDEFYQYVKSKKHLNLKGIMTVLPINAPE